jgi:hypothetical protein
MKHLNNYLIESSEINDLLLESIYDIDENAILQSVYESILYKLYSNNMINKGFFSKIGQALKKLGDKALAKGEDLDQKIDKLSDAGKSALKSVKNKEGDAWNDIKGRYVNTVSAIDSAIKSSDDSISDMADKFKIKKYNLLATIQMYIIIC